jgi:hypothetical protein
VPNEYFPDSITNGRESQIGLSAVDGQPDAFSQIVEKFLNALR